MNNFIQFLSNYQVQIVFGILIFFGSIEAIFGYFSNSNRSKDDVFIEAVNTFFLMFITKPLVAFGGFYILTKLFPPLTDIAAGNPLWLNVVIFLLISSTNFFCASIFTFCSSCSLMFVWISASACVIFFFQPSMSFTDRKSVV